MKPTAHWVWEFMNVCADTPCVHGQMLPPPHVEQFVKRIQIDSLRWAFDEMLEHADDPALGYGSILKKIESLTI